MKKLILLTLLLLLAACQSTPAAPSTLVAAAGVTTQAAADDFPIQSSEPLAADEAGTPVRLVIPMPDLTIPVEAMGWQVTQVEGERKAVWEVPANSAGWHLNSARPGTAGNMVFSGHHVLGAAVFAPLARGEVTTGAPLLVSDDQGRTFLYRVSHVGEPLPALGASAAEQQQAAAYLAPATTAQLTLITGWPDFSDTHYLFVVADFVGMVQ
ncbi:MAG: class F sortase [Caldilineaceae bacterium]